MVIGASDFVYSELASAVKLIGPVSGLSLGAFTTNHRNSKFETGTEHSKLETRNVSPVDYSLLSAALRRRVHWRVRRQSKTCGDPEYHEEEADKEGMPDRVAENQNQLRQKFRGNLRARERLEQILRVSELVEQSVGKTAPGKPAEVAFHLTQQDCPEQADSKSAAENSKEHHRRCCHADALMRYRVLHSYERREIHQPHARADQRAGDRNPRHGEIRFEEDEQTVADGYERHADRRHSAIAGAIERLAGDEAAASPRDAQE